MKEIIEVIIYWQNVLHKWKIPNISDASSPNILNVNQVSQHKNSKPNQEQNRPTSNVTKHNHFEAIADNEESDHQKSSHCDIPDLNSKPILPSSIITKSDVHYIPFCNLLNSLIGDNFKCTSSTKGIIIYVSTLDAYHKCVKYLRDQNADFHCYQLPEDKAFHIVIWGLHYSTD